MTTHPTTHPTAMTPERWRAVDLVLQAALACEPEGRDAFVDDACGGDEGLRREVASLLAAHDGAGTEFLERPAAVALALAEAEPTPDVVTETLVAALAGRYMIERELGRGGMATVYLARDLRHERHVAIKVLRDAVAAAIGAERFLAEIRVTASLQHPNILPLFDSGSEGGGLLWYAMPYVEGETLRDRLTRDGRLPVDDAVRLAREVADALDHAHGHGVVHRDVKPENVLLSAGHALVADFGIALALEHAGGERLTRTGLTLGTPEYMAPEQAAGERAIDGRVDVYALGVLLHEMLVGEAPFAGSRQVVLQRMRHERATTLAARRADVPPAVDAAVLRALEKQPDARFATAGAFAAALVTTGEAVPLRVPAPVSRRRVDARVTMYAVLVALAVGVVGGWALGRGAFTPSLPDVAPSAWPPAIANGSDGGNGDGDHGLALVVVDRAGRPQRTIAADRPWTPRFSPDGRRVAYGAFGAGRTTSDIWVTDLAAGTTRRLTDDDGDGNDPQWSPDGAVVAYSSSAPNGKDLLMQQLRGGTPRILAAREGTQFASDWVRDGSALLVTDGDGQHDVVIQPADGSPSRPYAATGADETAARVSPDGRWIAYTSNESGRADVYVDSYPRPGQRVRISDQGGLHPVWRGDGRELYYWRGDELVAVWFGESTDGVPPNGKQKVLFRAPYEAALNTMYDVSPDGERFVIVRRK